MVYGAPKVLQRVLDAHMAISSKAQAFLAVPATTTAAALAVAAAHAAAITADANMGSRVPGAPARIPQSMLPPTGATDDAVHTLAAAASVAETAAATVQQESAPVAQPAGSSFLQEEITAAQGECSGYHPQMHVSEDLFQISAFEF
jgi:hypothetical protein